MQRSITNRYTRPLQRSGFDTVNLAFFCCVSSLMGSYKDFGVDSPKNV